MHNHPPLCCCSTRDVVDGKWHQTGEDDAHPVAQCEAPYCGRICPACPEHGELSQLAGDPRPGECPRCHQPIGRPHTDYCPFTGVVSTMPVAQFASQTSQPATTTSQPVTTHLPVTNDWPEHPITQCSPALCGELPSTRPT